MFIIGIRAKDFFANFNAALLSFNSALMILIATENRKSDTHVTFNNCLSKYHLKILEVTHDDIKPDNVYFGDNLGNISLYQLVKV